MASPLLNQKSKKKTKIFSTEQAVRFLKKYFTDLGYGGMKNFCKKHDFNYSTLNSIINHKPSDKKLIPIKKIALIFNAIGYECELQKTIEFHVTENADNKL